MSSSHDSENNPKQKSPQSSPQKNEPLTPLELKNLEKMETLLEYSSRGIHILFEHQEIVEALNSSLEDKDFFDFAKMKKVQDSMTTLITKGTLIEKKDYLRTLDPDSKKMLIRTYFHLVESSSAKKLTH